MQIVIEIDEEYYDYIKEHQYPEASIIFCAIKNGTPLPKGHGDLVDFDKLCEEYWDGNYLEIHCDELASIQPIIEADKGE